MIPPPRLPEYFSAAQDETTRTQAALWLLDFLARQLTYFPEWRGDDELRVRFDELSRSEIHARFGFMWLRDDEAGSGVVSLGIGADDWVIADVRLGAAPVRRFWIEQIYEEIEFWPDGGISTASPLPDAPGQISKRGVWVQYVEDGRLILNLEIDAP
jgi:hypothetical protein